MFEARHSPKERLLRWWYRWETPILKWFTIIGGAVVIFFLLTGCASTEQRFVKEPGNFACAQVVWSDTAKIQSSCAPGSSACATVGNGTIWTPKPASFDDFWNVYRLGHEFLHSLGATHD